MKANIFGIKKFAVHDGEGIRTTVFFKGCTLNCVWCHNPEGISSEKQLAYYKNKCVNCGRCVNSCPSDANVIISGNHIFDRRFCMMCGNCEMACLHKAFEIFGRVITVEELVAVLTEDKEFYDNSGGGITLSGGECLCQSDFCVELLKICKEKGINTAVDTCGNIEWKNFKKILPYTDTFLYDIKAIDNNVHIKCTGSGNKLILDNLKRLDKSGAKIEIRIPYVPNYNSGEISKIQSLLKDMKNIVRVRVLPYHNYASSKYEALGIKNTLPHDLPSIKEIELIQNLFYKKT